MNARIKALAAQAGILQPERFDAIDGSNQLDKLAELIVKECALIADHAHGMSGSELLEHFGIEE